MSDRHWRTLRVATYNIHRCRGLDGRTNPGRVAEVIRSIEADVVALQEVIGAGQSSAGHAEELGALLGRPQITVRGLDELRGQSGDADAASPNHRMSAEEEAAAIADALENHYRATLDEPVPVLGGLTPRAAAKSKAGQRKLVDWLKYLENQTAKAAIGGATASYDFGWMWDELGIAHLRK